MLGVILLLTQPVGAQARKIKRLRNAYRDMSPEKLRQDILTLQNALQKAHPSLDLYIDPDSLELLFARAINSNNTSKNSIEFYQDIARLMAAIGCGHTSAFPSSGHYLQQIYFAKYGPLNICYFDSVARVLHNFSGNNDISIGDHVLSINNVPVREVWDSINSMIPSDGYNENYIIWDLEIGFFYDWYNLCYGDFDDFEYVLLKDNGDTLHVTLPAVGYFDIKENMDPFAESLPEAPILDVDYIDSINAAVLTIKSFDPDVMKRYRTKFIPYLDQVFRQMSLHGVENLIIDLRGNQGGSTSYMVELLSHFSPWTFNPYDTEYVTYNLKKGPKLAIWGRKAYKRFSKRGEPVAGSNKKKIEYFSGTDFMPAIPYFAGNLYILVNGGTYSAASDATCYLKFTDKATVIGTETSGTCGPITAGLFGSMTLPNSKIEVEIPLIQYSKQIPADSVIAGRGAMPNYPVNYTWNEFISGEDMELRKAIEVIQQRMLEDKEDTDK